jgi:3-carboxy-cis,cis-muconate cycloisomerase
MLACAKGVRHQAGLMMDAMIQDFKRATGPWHAERLAIPKSFLLTASALHQAKFALGGLIVAEAVMMALAPQTGRREAHDIGCATFRAAHDTGVSLLRHSAATRR